MIEKELRIALVCFGGISLAVYMHGISKEILKLVRASGALHGIRDRAQRAQAGFFDTADRTDPEYDTEEVYFELLREIGHKVELRVIVDIVAGASAGGINGTMLARALSHDLPMGALRDLWLDNADVSELLAPEAKAGTWSKWFIKPFLWLMWATGRWGAVSDSEARSKLSLFLRSRWFKSPLSGPRMAKLMFDGVRSMGTPKHPLTSLLPSGQGLDLYVTLTDHYGYHRLVQIHDPPLIHEREHRHVLHFRYRRRPNGEVESDFDLENAPALAFAARATSSFPGAFPPAQIVEMDQVIAEKCFPWPRRAEFIARNFEHYAELSVDPSTIAFVDGSVLNNRPFREAIIAIRGRPAYRQVDRRLVYIDPDPTPAASPAHHGMPSFFASLKAALSDIPSTEPVTDELNWVSGFNDRVRRLRAIIAQARPRVSDLVATVVTASFDRPFTSDQVRTWREQVHVEVVRNAGFAYEGYVRLKLTSVRAFLGNLIATLRGARARSPLAHAITEIIDAWAVHTGTVYSSGPPTANLEGTKTQERLPNWVEFLLAFDVDYRKRRLHFLIEGQNRLYQIFAERQFTDFDRAVVDRLKRSFYECADLLNRRERATFYSRATHDLVGELFPCAPSVAEAKDLQGYARNFVEQHREKIDLLVERLATEIDLNSTTDGVDQLLASTDPSQWHPDARREVFVNYLGFPFWDVLTFPLMTWREVGEYKEILVDRISPQDAHTLGEFSGAGSLMGLGFGHFASFFSRAYREKDYLLGRIHGLDRLIDIVCDSAGLDADQIDVVALKKRAFTRILDAEERHLPNSATLIAAIRRCVESLGPSCRAKTL